MNNKFTKLFPFVFVFVLALDGHAKTPTTSNISDIIQNLEEYYVPSTPKSFKKIRIKNLKKGKYFISFQTSYTSIRIEWSEDTSYIKLNGVKLSKKSVLHSTKIESKVRKIIGHSKSQYSLLSLFISPAHAMPATMTNVIVLLLKYIMTHMTAMNQYEQPQKAYVQPTNYGPNSIFSEATEYSENAALSSEMASPVVAQKQFTPAPQNRELTTTQPPTSCPSGYDAMECKVVELTNEHRRRNGRPTLTIGPKCTALADSHAQDMSRSGFFSHTSPSQGDFKTRTQSFGLSGAGENIASGQRTPESVMQAWIQSPGHNENLLRTNFTKIGVSRVGNEWVQCFSR